MYAQRTFDGNPQFWPKFTRYMLKTDVEFVTKVTSDNHVKKNWVRVNFPRITAKNYPICDFAEFRLDFSQNNWSNFLFE
jgi:hypothetical protein